MNNPEFYETRKQIGTSDQIICLFVEFREDGDAPQYAVVVYDPLQDAWETLPDLPHFPGCYQKIPEYTECVSVNQRLVLIGGYNPTEEEDVNTVFIYDFSSAQWIRGADMPLFRTCGALSVSPEGLVYIAGGVDSDDNALRGAAVYSVEEDEWKLLPDMSQGRFNCYSEFRDGKFFVIGDDATEVYDPKRGAWTTIPKEEGTPTLDGGIFCSLGARSFSVHMQQGVMEYDSNEEAWRAVCPLPRAIEGLTSCVAWRDKIFVSGCVEGTGDEVFYMFTPPPVASVAGAQGESFGKWDAIVKPQHFHVDYVGSHIEFAVTVEI